MACYHPSKVNVNRKSSIDGVRVPDRVTVPCGHCLGCRSDQARTWAVRLVHESQEPERPAWFCTLTYDPESVPEFGSLDPEHATLFLKRLRRRVPERVSYFICGEYGDRTSRPHYHCVLYGPRFLDRDVHRHGVGPVFVSETLESSWSHGFCEFEPLSYASARYVAGYVRKKVRQADNPEHYERYVPGTGELVQLQREYARMSLRPAIGKRWIGKYWRDVYPRDYVVIDGHELKPPRYYDKWMDRHHPDIMANVREQRIEDAVEIGDEKLIMKEKVHRARVALFEGRDGV